MLFGIFGENKILDDESITWMFDSFEWALRNFGSDVFNNEKKLVLQNNEYFHGKENSVHGKANLIFDKVKVHEDVKQVPCHLGDEKN